jgi:hypothetical protein
MIRYREHDIGFSINDYIGAKKSKIKKLNDWCEKNSGFIFILTILISITAMSISCFVLFK